MMKKTPTWFGLPRTKLGKWTQRLMGASLALMGAWTLWVALAQRDHTTFWSDPVHAVLIIAAAAAGSASGLTGVLSILLKRERSLLLVATTLAGCFIGWWTYMEILFQP
jgi:hypothetical protein